MPRHSFENSPWRRTLKRLAFVAPLLPLACVSGDKLVVDPEQPSTEVARLLISPSDTTIRAGESIDFTAVGLTASGDTATIAVTWFAKKGTVTNSSSEKPGKRLGHYKSPNGKGRDTVVVSDSSGNADTATVIVTDTVVAAVVVTPSAAEVQMGATLQLTAVASDSDGNALSGLMVSWTTSASAIATVSSSGLVEGVSAGEADISATVDGVSGLASIVVTEPPPPPPPGSEVVLIGAGDIAACGDDGAENTARILDAVSGTVFTTGDNAYPDGTANDFANCYHPTWGRHKSRTRPSPGNHDYHTSGATGYYDYFGSAAGVRGQGYYSYDLGEWHIVALNSNIDMDAGSAQEQWLRADLAATTKQCVVAYWHHPRFSSGDHGNSTRSQGAWEALYDAGAEIVLAGHDHTYERFAPQTPQGTADAQHGIREFVVGTGGKSLYGFGTPEPNSEVRYNSTDGVLKLTLQNGAYSWEFIPTSGSYTDSGSGTCH